MIGDRVRVLDLSFVTVLASLSHGGCVGGPLGERCRTLDNRASLGRVFETDIVCGLVWILAGRAVVDITGHISLAVHWCCQIGSAGPESEIVAANIPVTRVVAIISRELLEVGVEFLFILPLANPLDHEEYCANNDGGTD